MNISWVVFTSSGPQGSRRLKNHFPNDWAPFKRREESIAPSGPQSSRRLQIALPE